MLRVAKQTIPCTAAELQLDRKSTRVAIVDLQSGGVGSEISTMKAGEITIGRDPARVISSR